MEPVRKSFSEEELHTFARKWMIAIAGLPKDLDPDRRDRWYIQLGLLTEFIGDLWNGEIQNNA